MAKQMASALQEKLHQVNECERRAFADARHQPEAATAREERMYRQFNTYMDTARTDLRQSAEHRATAAALQAELQIFRAAASAATVPPAEPSTATSVDVPESASAVHQASTAVSVCAPQLSDTNWLQFLQIYGIVNILRSICPQLQILQ